MKKSVSYAVMTANELGIRELVHSIGMRRLSPHTRLRDVRGYAMAALLVLLGVMGILSTMLLHGVESGREARA